MREVKKAVTADSDDRKRILLTSLVGTRVSRPAWEQIGLLLNRQIMEQIGEDSR